jgi:hypothetical protein
MNYNNQNVSLTFGEIVLGQLKIISELSNHELKTNERLILMDNNRQVIENEDTRLGYIQSIENLCYILKPYFDKGMKKVYDDNLIFLRGFGFQIVEAIKEEDIKKKLESLEGDAKSDFVIQVQLLRTKDVFVELSHLLKRVSYLKAEVYGESINSDDIIEDEEDD